MIWKFQPKINLYRYADKQGVRLAPYKFFDPFQIAVPCWVDNKSLLWEVMLG